MRIFTGRGVRSVPWDLCVSPGLDVAEYWRSGKITAARSEAVIFSLFSQVRPNTFGIYCSFYEYNAWSIQNEPQPSRRIQFRSAIISSFNLKCAVSDSLSTVVSPIDFLLVFFTIIFMVESV